ncbi:MAG: dephospho-CoA kinase [Bacteroidales bacterium]|nr:dephospho-CoA kinase [Bacteroidales bacterium]
MMKVLVITGGIGSGKSAVCRILHEAGITAQYNADERVKTLYSAHPTLLKDIEECLGCVLRNEHGVLVPAKLAARIFPDPEALHKVESLVFPALIEDFNAFAENHKEEDIIVFESATILEKPQFEGFGDKVVLVEAPYEVRLERACARDEADRAAVEARMANQKLMNALSGGGHDPRIDAVIMNDSDLDELRIRTSKTMTVLFEDWKR